MSAKPWKRRCFALFLMLFGFFFGSHWKNAPLCLGGRLFQFLGLPAWSNGTEGTHYPGLIGLLFFFGGMILFANTTKKRWRTYLLFLLLILLLQLFSAFCT